MPYDVATGLWNLSRSLSDKERDELVDYVIVYANDCELSPKEFYAELKKELARRKIPEFYVQEVEHSEAGFGSANRVYLRLQRDVIYFDVCAAPFGSAFFFSYRAVVSSPLPMWIKTLILSSCVFIGLVVVGMIVGQQIPLPQVMIVAFPVALLIFVIGVIVMLQRDSETYYKFDTRTMFVAQTKEAFHEVVTRLTEPKAVTLTWRALYSDNSGRAGAIS